MNRQVSAMVSSDIATCDELVRRQLVLAATGRIELVGRRAHAGNLRWAPPQLQALAEGLEPRGE